MTRLIACSLPWRTVAAEIAKCSVRCASCHRRRTNEMFGFWRARAEATRREQRHVTALTRLQAVVHPV